MKWKNGARAAMTLCFDDGFRDTYKLTSELLSDYGIRATYFVPTAYVGGTFYGFPSMSLDDLRECVDTGMEIGSHSLTHCEYPTSVANKIRRALGNLAAEESKVGYFNYILSQIARSLVFGRGRAKCRNDDIQSEIMLSKELLERELSPYRVTSFAYPRGSFTRYTEQIVERSGYSSARTTVVGLNNPDRMDLFSLKCKVWRHYTDVSTMNLWLDRAMETEAWLIELFHRVSDDSRDSPEACQLSELRAHLDYATEKKAWIDTQQNVVAHARSLGEESLDRILRGTDELRRNVAILPLIALGFELLGV